MQILYVNHFFVFKYFYTLQHQLTTILTKSVSVCVCVMSTPLVSDQVSHQSAGLPSLLHAAFSVALFV